MTMYLPA